MYFNHPEKSALVELVMKDATEAERREATRHWFDFLGALLKIVDEDERKKTRQKTSASINAADILPLS